MTRWVDVLARQGVTTPNVYVRRHDAAIRLLMRSAAMRERIANTGAIIDYADWCLRRYGAEGYSSKREMLWRRIADSFTGPVRGVEFGVAHGYSTAWWLDRLGPDSTWDGFDRFTGLPRAWRFLPSGEFDNGGVPPTIDDARVTWHVGDISDTVGELGASRDGRPWLVLFDLDLYEPSKEAWDYIAPLLVPGDVLYFDEAYDRDERHLIERDVLMHLATEAIGWTPMGLALRVA